MKIPKGLTPGKFLTYAILVFWSAVCLFPLCWLAVTSLKGDDAVMSGPYFLPYVDFVPVANAWKFILLDTHENLLASYFNSFVISLTSTLLVLTAGGMAVYGLTRFGHAIYVSRIVAGLTALGLLVCAAAVPYAAVQILLAVAAVLVIAAVMRMKPRGRTIGNHGIMASMLATRILPPATLAVPIYLMAMQTGMLDTRLAIIVTYTAINLPVALWLLQPVLGPRATEQEEAAQLDGASHIEIFFTITVPMVAGGIAATGFLIFVLAWNEYLLAAVLATDHAMTLPTYLVGQMSMKEAQVGGEAQEWANFSAASLIIALPMLALAGVAQRVLASRQLWKR